MGKRGTFPRIKQLGAGHKGRSLSSGEMGCLLSHHAITDKAVRNKHEYTLILEDQLVYRSEWMDDLQKLMGIPNNPPDILALFQRKRIVDGDPRCKREIISKEPYLDIVTESRGGQGNTKAWLYSLRAMNWLYDLYNERNFLAAADGYVSQNTIDFHKEKTGEELVWMTTGNYCDELLKDHTLSILNTRSSRWAQDIATCRSAGGRTSVLAIRFTPLPRLAGVTIPRQR